MDISSVHFFSDESFNHCGTSNFLVFEQIEIEDRDWSYLNCTKQSQTLIKVNGSLCIGATCTLDALTAHLFPTKGRLSHPELSAFIVI